MKQSRWTHFDQPLFLLTALATLMGLLFIFDAGYPRSLQGGGSHFPPEFVGQLKFLIPSIVVSLFLSRIQAEKWLKASRMIWVGSLLLLIAVEVVGHTMNGAKRWLGYGPVMVQPAEFAKIATVIYMAAVFAKRSEWKAKPHRNFATWLDNVAVPKLKRALPAIWVLLAVGLIEKEPDLGTGAVIAATAFAMFIPGKVSKWSIVAACVLAVIGAGALVVKEPYRWDRVVNHVHRWDMRNVDDVGYQTVQSELAMANGGVLGVGIGAGRAKHVMPATTTDFIMATIGEEFGLVGALVVIAVLGALVMRLLYLARRASDPFRMLVLYGVAAWIGIQASVNIMMANAFLPAIGIPLPFISSGGSSLMALWIAIGICQSMLTPEIAREDDREARGHWRRNRRTHLPGSGRSSTSPATRRPTEVPRVPAGPRG